MHRTFFDHIDIKAENINIPDGTVSIEEIKAVLSIMKLK
jgi:glucosamine-6-phosphate deaminase